jgi:rod shape-determining protein MreC
VKPRVLAGTGIFLLFLTALPLPAAASFRSSLYSFLKTPIAAAGAVTRTFSDLFHFRGNAADARKLKDALARVEAQRFETRETAIENKRLLKLLDLKQSLPPAMKRAVAARVIGRTPLSWNRVFLIGKGGRDGVKVNMPVLSGHALAGKVVETGPSVSKVLLLTDPNARVAVVLQRTRQQGVLYGAGNECRIKYLSVDAAIKRGDVVETAGFGDFFPKGLRVGTVDRVWKEPGQIYQVAAVTPLAELDRTEEVLCVE